MRASRLPTLVVAAIAALVTACGELPHPFQSVHDNDANMKLMPIDKAGVVVRPPDGMPQPAAQAFAKAMIDALRHEDVAAMAEGNPESLVLNSTAASDTTGWNITLALTDSAHATVGSTTSHADPKAANDPQSWSPFAATMAKSVAAMLQPSGTAMRADQPSVAIGDIRGLPDGSRRMLVHALEFELQKSRLQIAASPEKATHVLLGDVTIAPVGAGLTGQRMSNVDVHWTVRRADHSEVGQLHQSNDVPDDLLDHDWPDIALAVADAAAGGIVDLVNQPAPEAH